jgi:hypothetical protein
VRHLVKNATLVMIIASVHFGAVMLLAIALMSYGSFPHFRIHLFYTESLEPPLWEKLLEGFLQALCQPAHFACLHFNWDHSIFLSSLNSILWGTALLPVLLFAKRRIFQPRHSRLSLITDH